MVTIKKLARVLKLDVSTVSRALRDDPRVKEATKERVRYLAKELGYQPNLAARSLASGTTKTIWFILPELTDPVEGRLPQHTSLVLAEEGYDLLVAIHQNNPEINERLLNRLHQGITDGVFIVRDYSNKKSPMEEKLLRDHYPVVFLDRYVEGQEAHTVTTDNYECGKNMVDLCYENGALDYLVLFTDKNDNMVERNRLRGVMNRIRNLKLKGAKGGKNKTRWRNTLKGDKLCLLASSQEEILEFVRTRQEDFQGKKLYFGVFDQWIGSSFPANQVFVCIQDFEEISRAAVEQILNKINKKSTRPGNIIKIPPKKIKIIKSIF